MRLLFIVFVLIFNFIGAQNYEYDDKMIIGIYNVENKPKEDIYTSINKWISINYNSAQNVIQLNNKETGDIIIKGINEVVYKNGLKNVYPKNKYIPEYNTIKLNHTIEINIKDNKYRIKYLITNIASKTDDGSGSAAAPDSLVFNLIDLNGLNDDDVIRYNNYIEELWKKMWVGKKRIKKQTESTVPVFEQLNKDVVSSIKLTMLSIYKSVNSEKEDW